jgi:hypothetical protein
MLHKVATSWAALPADVTRSVVVRGTEEACEPAWVIRTSIHGMHAASQLTAAGDPNVSEATITQKRGRTGELDVHLITTQPDATHPRCLVVAQAIQPTLQAWSALPSTVRSRVVFRTGTIPTCDGRGSLAAAFEQLGKIRFVPSTHAAPSVARYWLRSPYDFFERP